MEIEETAYRIIERLNEKGFEAYVAGGAARDTLNGDVPVDFDVVTDALPRQIETLFRKERVRTVGVSFKVCLVNGVEVSTYRSRRGYGRSTRNRTPIFAGTLKEDLACRDLTINSLAYSPITGETVDLFGGVHDLENGIIRFTRSADERIVEDPCRIVRACRFMAKYEARFEEETLQSLKRLSPRLVEKVSPERIRLEIVKALSCDRPSLFFRALRKIGALAHILPGLDACYGCDGGPYHAETVWDHSLYTVDAAPKKFPMLRLAALLHDIGKPVAAREKSGKLTFIGHEMDSCKLACSHMRRLKFSNDDIAFVTGLVKLHMRTLEPETTPRAIRRLIKALNDERVDYRDWIRLRIADRKANLKRENYTLAETRSIMCRIDRELNPKSGKQALSVRDLEIDGKEIMALLSLPQGPEIGRVMEALLERVLEDPSLNRKEALRRIAATL